jgi:putative membrane protein
MIRALLINWFIIACAFAVTGWLLSGMELSGGVAGVLWVSALFGVINALLGTIIRILTLPLTVLTLGLFAVIINAVLLEVTDWITDNLTIDHFFWTAIWAAIIMALVTVVLDLTVGRALRPKRR